MSVTLGVAAVLAATFSGCSADAADQEEYDYGAVCADQQTLLRVGDDDDCDDRGSYGWYYIPVGSRAAAVERSPTSHGFWCRGGNSSSSPDRIRGDRDEPASIRNT